MILLHYGNAQDQQLPGIWDAVLMGILLRLLLLQTVFSLDAFQNHKSNDFKVYDIQSGSWSFPGTECVRSHL